MDHDRSAVGQSAKRDRVVVGTGLLAAAVQFPDQLSVVQQQRLGAALDIHRAIPAGGDRLIERWMNASAEHTRIVRGAVGCPPVVAADQVIAVPVERDDPLRCRDHPPVAHVGNYRKRAIADATGLSPGPRSRSDHLDRTHRPSRIGGIRIRRAPGQRLVGLHGPDLERAANTCGSGRSGTDVHAETVRHR